MVRGRDALTSQLAIKTDTAPNTALSGGNISEDSLAISTAILAAAYAVCQPAPLPWPMVSLGVPWPLLNAELMERAMEADEIASALGSFRDVSFRISPAGNVGVETGESSGNWELRRRGIMGANGRR